MSFSLFGAGKPAVKTVLQGEANECGLACLAMIANYHGHRIDLAYLRSLYSVSLRGMSLADIVGVATALGLDAQGYGISTVGELKNLGLPALLHWRGNHFVVLERIAGGKYYVNDPEFGPRLYEQSDMERYFSGTALEFQPKLDLKAIKTARTITFVELFRSFHGLRHSIGQIVVASIAISLLALATPVLLEVALDTVIPQTDVDLLTLVAIGLALFMTFEAIGRWLRDYITLRSAILFQLQFTRNVVDHSMRLPMRFFEQRHPSDYVTRMDSIEHVKTNFVGGLISSLGDTVTSVLAIALMFYYSPSMTGVTLLTLVIVVAIRLLTMPTLKLNANAALDARTEERTLLLDGLRRVDTLKAHNQTTFFTMKWFESFVRFANADFNSRKAAINAEFLMHAAIMLSTVITLYMGVLAVMQSALSIGMLYAFFSLRTSFFDRVNTLTTELLHFSMMKVHFQRLDEIIAEEPEKVSGLVAGRALRQTVALQDVKVQFGDGEPPILEHVNLTIDIARKETIAILGVSGSGKSSLMKILAGLNEPAAGTLRIDGRSLDQFGRPEYRANLGVVFADDGVFAGTIAENLALFDPGVSVETMLGALTQVGLNDEIERLPQGLTTLISEESSVLSTGQRRRLLLARALCRAPRLLLLDEITANLDPDTEFKLIKGLSGVAAAKVFVTHSETLLAHVDRVFRIQNGMLVEHRGNAHKSPPTLVPTI